MNARERVLRALRRIESAHPPFTWGFGPNESVTGQLTRAMERQGVDWRRLRRASEDVAWLNPTYCGPALPEGQAEYMAVWGIETRTVEANGVVYNDEIARNPLSGIDDPRAFEDYAWPSTSNYDYTSLGKVRAELDPQGVRAVRLTVGNPFEIYAWLVGYENALMHLIAEPALVEAGMMHICRFLKAHFAKQVSGFSGEADIAQVADDVGSQSGLLFSALHYRDVIQPFHRDLLGEVRTLLPDAVIAYHSDGAVFDLLPDLMGSGVQMLEAVQVECVGMAPERLADAFGDSLLFQGAIGVQTVLPHGTQEEVRYQCRRLIDTLGRGGGYLAAPSHAIQGGTPPENILAMLKEVLGEERYGQALAEAS